MGQVLRLLVFVVHLGGICSISPMGDRPMDLEPLVHWFNAQTPPQITGHSYQEGNSMIGNFLKATSIHKETESEPSDFHANPHKYTAYQPLPWEKLGLPTIATSNASEPEVGLEVRHRGPLRFWESSPWFQTWSRWCVDTSPKAFSVHSLFCSGIMDFGLSLFIAAKSVQDAAVCAVMGQATGDELLCLGWQILRLAFPGLLPEILDIDFPFWSQRLPTSSM
eukprot:snap_masked-scaffold758_size101577-processed-gene-0.11 protein:Tk05294 transcript:snap_masked-scaffold758_size101577-processed-gene-0.11-mRNA-1 annotation:"hypothetical protein G5I_04729"